MLKDFTFFTELIVKFLNAIFLILSFLTLTSCEKIILSNEGQIIKKIESYEYFSQISFYDIFDVELKTDSVYSVKLMSYEKYVDNISIKEDSGELVFHDYNFARWLPDYPRPKLTISFPRLNGYIFLKSPVKLTNYDTLRLEKLSLILLGKTGEFDLTMDVNHFKMVTGSDNFGYYIFKGKTNTADFWPRGSSQVDASGLSSMDCFVYNNSIGDCYVNVSHKLEVRLNTLGNVIYSGYPEEIVILEQSGSGKVLHSSNN